MKINDVIGNAKTIGIAGHIRPDGDCIGSCMALYNYLKKNRTDLEVRVFLEYVDPKFQLIPNAGRIETDGYDGTVFDLFISLDTAGLDRLGQNREYFQHAQRTVCIDHHKSNPGYADANFIVAEASSASEVLFNFLEPELFDKTIAIPLYMGIAHDSGVFRFQSTTPKTMRIAADLMEYGFDINEILEETFYKKSYNQFMITARIQSDAVLTMDGRCIYGYCTTEMMERFGVTKNDLDAVIASLRNVDGVEVAMFMYQLEPEVYKVSLRSKHQTDVSSIAMKFGGGGHIHAAGFDIRASLEDAIRQTLAEIEKAL